MATGTGSQVLDDLAAALGCSVSTVDDDEDCDDHAMAKPGQPRRRRSKQQELRRDRQQKKRRQRQRRQRLLQRQQQASLLLEYESTSRYNTGRLVVDGTAIQAWAEETAARKAAFMGRLRDILAARMAIAAAAAAAAAANAEGSESRSTGWQQ